MENNMINKLATLTTMSRSDVDSIMNLERYCIGDALLSDVINNKETTEINIGIGMLIIHHTSSEVKYKFIPDAKLEEEVRSVILNKETTLEKKIEETLKYRLTHVYKELL